MTELTRLTIAEAREKLGAKEITAVELTDAYLGAIEAANGALNAYVTVTPEKAREMAKASDVRIAEGKAIYDRALALQQQQRQRYGDKARATTTHAATMEQGTLADVVTRYGAWADCDVLVSGSPSMIRSTVSRMLVAGTPLDRITYDPFTLD